MRFLTALISFWLCVSAWAEAPAANAPSAQPLVAETPKRSPEDIEAKKKISAQLSPEMKEKVQSLYAHANDFLQEEEYEAAVIRFKQLLDIDPANSAAHYHLAEAYIILHDLKQAASHYHDVIYFAPESQEAVLAQVRLSKIEKPAAPAPAAAPAVPVPPAAPASAVPASSIPASGVPAAPASKVPAPASPVSVAPASAVPATSALAVPASAVPAIAS